MQTSARSYKRVAVEKIKSTDLDGTTKNLFTKLPNGVLATALYSVIITPFDAATSHVLDIGHGGLNGGAASGNAFANDIDLKGAAGTRVQASALPTLVNDTKGGVQLQVTDVKVGAETKGEVWIVLEYVESVEQFSQG